MKPLQKMPHSIYGHNVVSSEFCNLSHDLPLSFSSPYMVISRPPDIHVTYHVTVTSLNPTHQTAPCMSITWSRDSYINYRVTFLYPSPFHKRKLQDHLTSTWPIKWLWRHWVQLRKQLHVQGTCTLGSVWGRVPWVAVGGVPGGQYPWSTPEVPLKYPWSAPEVPLISMNEGLL